MEKTNSLSEPCLNLESSRFSDTLSSMPYLFIITTDYEEIHRIPGYNFFFLLKNVFNVYSFLKEGETEREQGRSETEGDTDLKQVPGSELSAQSPMRGLNS